MLETDAEKAKKRRAKLAKEQGVVGALILARDNKQLRADLATVQEQLAEMRVALVELIDIYENTSIADEGVPERRLRAYDRAKQLLSSTPAGGQVIAETTLSQEYDDISETLVYETEWVPPQDVEFHIRVFGAAQERFSKANEIIVTVRAYKPKYCDFCGRITAPVWLRMVTDEKKNNVWLCPTCRGYNFSESFPDPERHIYSNEIMPDDLEDPHHFSDLTPF